ncbi:MAG: PD-(D/E)XK nuclease family protein [Actinomycetota bacterium]
MRKPQTPARENISPSDLTFGLSTCKRCLWIKYWHKVVMPGAFPLVGTFSAMQEKTFRGVATQDIDPNLRPGRVTKLAEWVKSKPIVINGAETRWRILGKYDLVAENDDGTVALIDCKVSDSSRDSGDFYSPQLEAYAYALEIPAAGKAVEVATMGLLVWKPDRVIGNSPETFGFGVKQSYVPVGRDQSGFLKVLSGLIDVLEGPLPDSGSECTTCNYLVERLRLDD